MKAREETIKDYRERVNNVLIHINNHLDEDLDIKKLAAVANFSPYHFHRIIRAFIQEPLGAYIARIRLETAARLLRFSTEQVSDIAYKIGYETPAAFTKSFHKRFGVSPLEFRNNKNTLNFTDMTTKKSDETLQVKLKPKVKELNEKKIIFISVIGEYGNVKTGEAWNKLMDFVKKNRLFSWKMECFGVSHDDPAITEASRCRYDACITVQKEVKPEGEIGVKEISGGKYAIFKYKGSYEKLGEVYNLIFKEWLPQSGLKLREVPCLEKYLNNPNKTKPEKLATEIYIPVI